MMKYIVYVLQNEMGDYYTGHTRNVNERLRRHKGKRGAKFIKGRGAVKLVYCEESMTRADAMKREKQIKGYSRKKKRHLVDLYSTR